MSNNTFTLSQGEDGFTRIACIKVPGCGRNEKSDAPVVMVELDNKTGEAVVNVYADINSTEPTHVIPLCGAKIGKKSV